MCAIRYGLLSVVDPYELELRERLSIEAFVLLESSGLFNSGFDRVCSS